MRNQRIADVCFWITIVTSAVAVSQQHTAASDQAPPARHDTTQLTRDINGRWQPTESRSVEIREVKPSERWEEETIRRPDMSGMLVLSERNVTHRFEANGAQQQVIETFSQDTPGLYWSGPHLTLRERVRVSTTPTPDGGRQTIEEVESRNSVAPGDPMRVVRRVVETVRNVGPDRWITERQVFERDVNGRLEPISMEREQRVPR
jgi:hypothetical protein